MLVNELAKMRDMVTLPSNPVVNGYIYEEKVFLFLNSSKAFQVLCGKETLSF